MTTIRVPEPVTKMLGSTNYRVRPLANKKANGVFAKILQLLGAGVQSGGVSPVELVAGAILSLSEERLNYFENTFAEFTEIEVDAPSGQGTNWPRLSEVSELHFSGNFGEKFEWLQFCLELNFGSLFKLAEAALAKQKAAAEAKKQAKASP